MESGKNKRSWRVPVILICCAGLVAAWLGYGEKGLVHLYRTRMERQACRERIRRLAKENQALFDEVQRLRTDMTYVESVARKELNLIRKNEVIYRFRSSDPNAGDIEKPFDPPKKKKEVRRDGRHE